MWTLFLFEATMFLARIFFTEKLPLFLLRNLFIFDIFQLLICSFICIMAVKYKNYKTK